MQKFYCLYAGGKFPQSVEELSDRTDETNFPQVVERLGADIFAIPWGHHRTIIDKCKDVDKALFFVRKTIENNWSRAVLLNFLDTNLYERQGKAISNFDKTLPEPQSDLAQEMTKDPYNFDFLTIQEGFYEKELKDALMDSIQSFLLELGTGFAFVGREYRLVVGNTEQFIDMLFYNITLHCYVVIEIKIRDFEPGDMGQISTYVAAVDGILRKEGDERTIGLLICKTKDNVLAQYAVNNITAPIGISEFELSKIVPEDFKGTLPTIEEIERELK
jgi:predicted nuclease of restriction endonuclease-like (RecB) superfamily